MVDYLTPDLLVDARAELGEAPRWDSVRQRVLWLDVDGGLLHSTDPVTGVDEPHAIGPGFGTLAPAPRGLVALARRDAFLTWTLDGEAPQPVAAIASAEDEVMNDGACDPAGRFWAGTYAEGERPGGGRLYRLGLHGGVETVLAGVTLSNGLGWSPDGTLMYYIDSATQGIDVFDYDVTDGAVARRRRLVTVPTHAGMPDGLATDDDGALWVGMWGGGAVHRYTPAGNLDRTVRLPATHVTACCFGGASGDTLFVTTAAPGPSAERHAGALFALRPGVTGPAATPLADQLVGPPA